MGNRNLAWPAALLSIGFLGALTAQRAPADPEVWVDTPRWQVELAADTELRISNPYGDVRGRSSADGKLLVVGIIQRFDPEQRDAEVLIEEGKGRVVVRTEYPSADQRLADGRLNGRIDLSVLVPAGHKMRVETGAGLIEVKGVDRELVARTTSGRIRLTTARAISAKTVSGELIAVLKNPTALQPALLATGTGPLRVDLLDSPALALHARTAGQILPRFGRLDELEASRSSGLSVLSVGKEPWSLEAVSKQGSIEIHALPPTGLR
jgi:hypothetical protein